MRLAALEQHREQIGDVAAMTGVPVLAGEPDLAAREELLHSARARSVAEAEQGSGRYPRARELAAQDRERRQADAASDEDRPGDLGTERFRSREGTPQWPGRPQALAPTQLREPLRPGADGLHHEVEPHAAVGALGLGDRERSRQIGAPVALPPAVGSSQHVELPRAWLGA